MAKFDASIATHRVLITRERLALWFDDRYEDGFKWNSAEGQIQFNKLQSKNLLFFRNSETSYQILRDQEGVKWQDARWREAYRDSALTEKGKVQAATLAVRAAKFGFEPELILTSTLTRSMQTATLTFPTHFAAFQGVKHTARVMATELLCDPVMSWADVERAPDVIAAEHPQLARFFFATAAAGAESASRYERVGCDPSASRRPRRWKLVTSLSDHDKQNKEGVQHPKQLRYPEELRVSARLRAALAWRLLADAPENNIAVFTHTKLVKHGMGIHLLGPEICKTALGEFESGDCSGWETIAVASLKDDPILPPDFEGTIGTTTVARILGSDDRTAPLGKPVDPDMDNSHVLEWRKNYRSYRLGSTMGAKGEMSSLRKHVTSSRSPTKQCIQCEGSGKVKTTGGMEDECPLCRGEGIIGAATIARVLGGGIIVHA